MQILAVKQKGAQTEQPQSVFMDRDNIPHLLLPTSATNEQTVGMFKRI